MRHFALHLAASGVLIMAWLSIGFGGEIDFIEEFVFAKDRAAVLKQLVPGTEDHSYYHALHFIQTEQYEKLDGLITNWVQRHGETQRVQEIRTRLALTTYEKNPQKTLEFLRNRLGLTFTHQKEDLNAEPNLPTTLSPDLISREAFIRRANSNATDNSGQYEDNALDWLVGTNLHPDFRRSVLSRLIRPDYDKLVKWIIEDLSYDRSGGFGSLGIHRQLLIPQLEELITAKPDLLNQQAFVLSYLTKLQPTLDDDWRHDPKLLEAYLDRLIKFANRLAPVHNSLKSHVLYHRLVFDRERDEFNKDRFIEYLKLPRPVGYLSQKMRDSEVNRRFPVDLNANYQGTTWLPGIGNDEPLVRSYLAHFFVDAKNAKEFEPYINDVYLQHLFAEVKILNGLGDAEQWAALLPPAQFQALKERVDLDFAFTNKTQFQSDEVVKLDLFVKNTGTLIVKVFEINAQNFYREQRREIDTDINLDGLVANLEQTHVSQEPPLRRVAKRFEFPQLEKPGVYIVDFIGNGQSSRALIRKGQLRHLVRTSPIGHFFTVLNDKNELVKDAKIWLNGHEYSANENGAIVVPFSENSVRQPIVISQGGISSLAYFQHESEELHLDAAFYIDRESLLAKRTSQVVVRTRLSIGGSPVSVKRLEKVKLTIRSTDLDDISSTQEIDGFKLFEDRESVHEFQIPPRLSSLQFTLTAKVKKFSGSAEEIELTAGDTVTLNAMEKTEKIENLNLLKIGDNYVLELLGKTGEAKPSRPVQISIKHRDFRQIACVVLKTDPSGRVNLGPLIDITSLTASGPENTQQQWILRSDSHTYPASVHAKLGEPVSVPFFRKNGVAAEAPLSRAEFSLLEMRSDLFAVDRFQNASFKDGFVVLNNLPVGDFDLLLKSSGTRIRVRVSDGPKVGGFVLGKHRELESPLLAPVQIESIKPSNDGVTIKISNVTKFTRVHLFATRFVPEYAVFDELGKIRGMEPAVIEKTPGNSVYLTGRNIGDEYRYIIDRKYATKFPGNSLERPSLLLNPWAKRSTETGDQVAADGGRFGAAGAPPQSAVLRGTATAANEHADTHTANLDFLSVGSAVLVNLVPNEEGIVSVPSDAIGPHQHLHVVAVDPLNLTYRNLSLPERKTNFIDLRLTSGLDPKKHFTQQKQITVVPAGQKLTLNDITTSKFELYDSLSSVYGLYTTLSRDKNLAEFSFILNWPKLTKEDKRTLYSKHASHELSFFLSKKDPEFFNSVIKPYLSNKKDKTFVDRFLLEENLAEFLTPWRFAQLNIVERVLLARRIKDERPKTARHVSDLYALLPRDTDRFIRLFDTAVNRGNMDMDDQSGLAGGGGGIGGGIGGGGGGDFRARVPTKDSERIDHVHAEQKESRSMPMEAAKKQRDAGNKLLKRSQLKTDAPADKNAVNRGLDETTSFFGLQLGEVNFTDNAYAAENESIRQLYRKLHKTSEWAENNYHHLTIDTQNASLISVNAFWKDFAQHDPNVPFLSRNLAEATRNFSEMLLALAVLDLPFESPKHDTKFEGARMTLTAGGPIVVYHEEVKPAAEVDGAAKVLVSQNFFRLSDRTRIEEGETVDKFVTDEFLAQVVYGCRVVVTNPTSSVQKIDVLLQIPLGAIPVLNSQSTKTAHLTLEPYNTETIEYHFYFPVSGQFSHFPVHVAKNETLIATATPVLFNVVNKPTQIDTGSWDHVSQQGSTDDVLAFLDTANVNALNLDRIAWRMSDPKVFAAVVSLLTQRHIYHDTLWSYAIKHNVPDIAREFLLHSDQIVNACGGRLKSVLLTIDPVARRKFEHLEYKPLVNARAHALGKRRQIVNGQLHEQYHQTLKQLSYDRSLNDDDLLTLTYYLLLQDRIEEATATFARVKLDKVATKMQYDYCAAYLDFFTNDHKQARAIAQKYVDHPVDRWRKTFAAITSQLDEAEGKDVKTVDEMDRTQQQTLLAATEPNFDFTVESKQIQLNHQNLKAIQINYYEMDVELLFSRNPFVQQFKGQFSSIKPNLSVSVELNEGVGQDSAVKGKTNTRSIPLPESLQNKNVLIEIVGAGLTKAQPLYSHSLAVQVIENYGQLKVTHQTTGKPVPKTYVKVYAQMADGRVKFYKDGYTDLRGRFEYASLNTDALDVAVKFSILILSDENGALVREATPPKR